jgi:hypothetical protein
MSDLTKLDAEFSQALEQIGEGWFRQLALGVRLGVPEALGLTRRQWSDRIGVTVRNAAERRGAVTELSAEGLSNRAIADVLGVDDRTVRRDLAGPSAAIAAPTQMPQGGDTALAAANAADDISEAVAYIVAAGDDVPERVKDAVVAIDASIRFFRPYRFGGRKVGEYEKRKLTDWLIDTIRLMWSERAFWREKTPTEWGALEKQWRSLGVPLDELSGSAP